MRPISIFLIFVPFLLLIFFTTPLKCNQENQQLPDIYVGEINIDFSSNSIPGTILVTVEILTNRITEPSAEFTTEIVLDHYGWDGKTLLNEQKFYHHHTVTDSEQKIHQSLPRKPGFYTINIKTDVNNEITESDETNNFKDHSFAFGLPPLGEGDADLKITDLYLNPEKPILKQQTSVICGISNFGKPLQKGLEYEVILKIGSKTKRYKMTTRGGRESVYITYPWSPSAKGAYQIECTIDTSVEAIAEDTNNNKKTLEVNIQ